MVIHKLKVANGKMDQKNRLRECTFHVENRVNDLLLLNEV